MTEPQEWTAEEWIEFAQDFDRSSDHLLDGMDVRMSKAAFKKLCETIRWHAINHAIEVVCEIQRRHP